jgi:hypothetical protein
MPAPTHKTGIMKTLLQQTTCNNQWLLLSIRYSCEIHKGVANYQGTVDCTIGTGDSCETVSCEFDFCRDPYWEGPTSGRICKPHESAGISLEDLFTKVVDAITAYELMAN